jgi:cell wall assembly regulator SMI1|tara:strand:+ start:76 stop:516 length:441 start_codon:yes stop_codon:yes gene_type:complete
MEIEKIGIRLEKIKKLNSNFEYSFGEKISSNNIEFIENKLNLTFPEKVKKFYSFTNGLKTTNPNFEIIELNKLKKEKALVHFATFDNNKKIYFETEKWNNANEWNIIEKETNYELTKTISSFWSNKIWHWIENKKRIWENEFWKTE